MAAAGLIALEDGPGRLHEDHARARRLAEGIAEIIPGAVDLEQVETNMVYVDTRGHRARAGRGPRPAGVARRRRDPFGREGPPGHPPRRGRRGDRRGARRVALRRGRAAGGGLMGLFTEAVPGGDRRADPAGPAAREDLAGPALRPDPVVRRHELGPRDLRRGGAPRSRSRTRSSATCRTSTVDADMHCVTGWTTLDNRWEGVSFKALTERAKPTRRGEVGDRAVRRTATRRTCRWRPCPTTTSSSHGATAATTSAGARLAAAPGRAEALRVEEREVADGAEVLRRTTSAASGRCAATTSTRSRSRRSATATRRAPGPSWSPSVARRVLRAAPRRAASRCPRGGGRRRRASRGSAAPPSAPAPPAIARQPASPMKPSPMFSCRSRRSPRGNFESFGVDQREPLA